MDAWDSFKGMFGVHMGFFPLFWAAEYWSLWRIPRTGVSHHWGFAQFCSMWIWRPWVIKQSREPVGVYREEEGFLHTSLPGRTRVGLAPSHSGHLLPCPAVKGHAGIRWKLRLTNSFCLKTTEICRLRGDRCSTYRFKKLFTYVSYKCLFWGNYFHQILLG